MQKMMVTLCPILLSKGNKILRKRSSDLLELESKYKPTQVMLNNVVSAPLDPLFSMEISDTYFASGRGSSVTGTISEGTIRTGDAVVIEGNSYQVLKIFMNKKMLANASAGMTVTLLINSGKVRLKPGTRAIGSSN